MSASFLSIGGCCVEDLDGSVPGVAVKNMSNRETGDVSVSCWKNVGGERYQQLYKQTQRQTNVPHSLLTSIIIEFILCSWKYHCIRNCSSFLCHRECSDFQLVVVAATIIIISVVILVGCLDDIWT